MTAPSESAPDVLPEPTEPRQHDWDEDPHTAARYDDHYWDNRYNRDEDS